MARLRVYELARDLNMTNKVLLEKLGDLDISVKSHMSALDDDIIAKIKSLFFDTPEKEEAIEMTFEFQTKVLGIPLDRYAVTCFAEIGTMPMVLDGNPTSILYVPPVWQYIASLPIAILKEAVLFKNIAQEPIARFVVAVVLFLNALYPMAIDSLLCVQHNVPLPIEILQLLAVVHCWESKPIAIDWLLFTPNAIAWCPIATL